EGIPEDKGEHPVQPLDNVRTPTTVAFENHLGIGAGSERRARSRERLTQLNEIINFTVENYDITPIATLHRLIAGGQVNNRQPTMAEEHFALTPLACRIWPTMSDCIEGASCCGNSDNRGILQDRDKTAHKSASIEIHTEDYRWNVASSMTNGSI